MFVCVYVCARMYICACLFLHDAHTVIKIQKLGNIYTFMKHTHTHTHARARAHTHTHSHTHSTHTEAPHTQKWAFRKQKPTRKIHDNKTLIILSAPCTLCSDASSHPSSKGKWNKIWPPARAPLLHATSLHLRELLPSLSPRTLDPGSPPCTETSRA
jgi:hypothetical protein